MKIRYILLLVSLSLLLSSCSTVQVSQDFDTTYNFTTAKTYNWNMDLQNSTKDKLKEDQLLAKRFFSAIDVNLVHQGYTLSDTPDLLVSCSYNVTSRIQSENVRPTIGFGYSRYGRYNRYGDFGIQSGTTVRQYDMGLLTINIHRASDDTLIWKGTATKEVFTHSNPDQITESVKEMVQSTLAQFPPTQ